MLKRFIIRKFIMANSASDAIKRDKKSPVDEVYIDIEHFDNLENDKLKFKKVN